MKKTIIVLIVLAGVTIIVFSCSKENSDKLETEKTTIKVLTDYEIQVNKSIKDFKENVSYYLENPHFKSGETISADSALWFLEATINYSHGFPNEYYKEMQTENASLLIPKNLNGKVDMVSLAQKYIEMKASVSDQYENSTFGNKGLVLVDLTMEEQTTEEITVNIQTVTGDKSNDPPPPPPVNGPFEKEDDWWYGEDYGFCYDHSVFDDAANQLYEATVDLIPDPSGNYYFINEYTFTIEGGDIWIRRPNDTEDNFLDYFLYYAVEGDSQIQFNTEETLCLEYQEMNNYYVFLKNMMFNILPNQYLPDVFNKHDYSIESFNFLVDDSYSDDDYTYYYHRANYTYGIKVGYNVGEGPTEL